MARGKLAERLKVRANVRESIGADDGPEPAAPKDPPRSPFGDPERLRDVSQFRASLLIPHRRIVPDPDQPRKEFDEDSLMRLVESIEERGILQPIRVRWDKGAKVYVILAGERRWRAAGRAGLEKVPCVVHEDDVGPEDLAVIRLVENCAREDLAPLEEARAFEALQERTGWTNREMGRKLGIDHQRIGKRLALLTLPRPVQGMVEAGELDPSTAREIARLDDPTEQLELAASATDGGMTRDEVAEEVRRIREPAPLYPRDTAGTTADVYPGDTSTHATPGPIGAPLPGGSTPRRSVQSAGNGGGVPAGAPGRRPGTGMPTSRLAPTRPEPDPAPVTVLRSWPGARPAGYEYRPRDGVVVTIAFEAGRPLTERDRPDRVLEETLRLARTWPEPAESAPRPAPGMRVRVESIGTNGKPRYGHGRSGVVEAPPAGSSPNYVWVALDHPEGLGVEHRNFRPEELVPEPEEDSP